MMAARKRASALRQQSDAPETKGWKPMTITDRRNRRARSRPRTARPAEPRPRPISARMAKALEQRQLVNREYRITRQAIRTPRIFVSWLRELAADHAITNADLGAVFRAAIDGAE